MLQFGNISFDPALWFCASGKSFFWGLLLITVTVIMSNIIKKKWHAYFLQLLRICALLLIILSSTAMHPLFYITALFLLIGSFFRSKKQNFFKTLFVVFALFLVFLELPFHLATRIKTENISCLYVIGDSVSAGMGNATEETWPILFEKETAIKTINLAQAGATAESALKQSSQISNNNCLVILEIGGNDLLGHTSIEEFETSCNELLRSLSSCEKTIWLELPLLPQHYPYGRIQRQLAKQHNITLVPKSVLARVFRANGATSDGIHLNQTGHKVMSIEIQKLIKKD